MKIVPTPFYQKDDYAQVDLVIMPTSGKLELAGEILKLQNALAKSACSVQ